MTSNLILSKCQFHTIRYNTIKPNRNDSIQNRVRLRRFNFILSYPILCFLFLSCTIFPILWHFLERKNNRNSTNLCGFVFAAVQMMNRRKTIEYNNDTENYSIQQRTTVNLTLSFFFFSLLCPACCLIEEQSVFVFNILTIQHTFPYYSVFSCLVLLVRHCKLSMLRGGIGLSK